MNQDSGSSRGENMETEQQTEITQGPIINSTLLKQAVEQTEKAKVKKTIESMVQEEQGNVGYRAKFLRDQLPYLEAFLEGKIVPPYELEVQPSSECNSKCRHCFSHKTLQGANKSKDLLTDGRMDEIITKLLEAEAYDLKVGSIKFIGSCGDPLVNPKTLDAIEACKQADRITKLFTNGLGLTYKDANDVMYADRLFNIDYIRISLDAGSEDAFNNVKNVEGFYNVLRGIERLRKLADKHESPLKIEIGYVITEKNYHDVYRACTIVKSCGAHSIRYRRDMIGDSMPHEEFIKVKQHLDDAMNKSDDNFKVLIVHSDKEFEGGNGNGCLKCYVPYFWVTVGSDGLLYPCGHRGGDFGWSIGNLLENDLMTILRTQTRNPNLDALPDNNCVVCPPYAKRLNPFLHYIAQQNGNVPCMNEILREILTNLV